MTLPTARSRSVKWWKFATLAVVVFIGGVTAAWRFTGSHDPFAHLEDEDRDKPDAAGSLHIPGGLPELSNLTPEQQMRLIDQQLHTDPNNPKLLSAKIHIGLEYAPPVAASECRRILAQSPDNYFALHHAAMAFLAMTNLERALYYNARALNIRETPEARLVMGHIFYAKGDFSIALKQYRAVLAKNPGDDAARAFVEKTERALSAGNLNRQPNRLTIKR